MQRSCKSTLHAVISTNYAATTSNVSFIHVATTSASSRAYKTQHAQFVASYAALVPVCNNHAAATSATSRACQTQQAEFAKEQRCKKWDNGD